MHHAPETKHGHTSVPDTSINFLDTEYVELVTTFSQSSTVNAGNNAWRLEGAESPSAMATQRRSLPASLWDKVEQVVPSEAQQEHATDGASQLSGHEAHGEVQANAGSDELDVEDVSRSVDEAMDAQAHAETSMALRLLR